MEPTNAFPTQRVSPQNAWSCLTPILTHTAGSKMNKHFSLSSAVAARDKLKEPSCLNARTLQGSSHRASLLRLLCHHWDPRSQQILAKWVPNREERGGVVCYKSGLASYPVRCSCQQEMGSDTAASKLPSLPKGPGVHDSFSSSRELCQQDSLKVTSSKDLPNVYGGEINPEKHTQSF